MKTRNWIADSRGRFPIAQAKKVPPATPQRSRSGSPQVNRPSSRWLYFIFFFNFYIFLCLPYISVGLSLSAHRGDCSISLVAFAKESYFGFTFELSAVRFWIGVFGFWTSVWVHDRPGWRNRAGQGLSLCARPAIGRIGWPRRFGLV